jgi:acetylornithine deacetylase/succinyl-diaminopimelate desuccinylase-like protein
MSAPVATTGLDARIAQLAARDLPLAIRILKEAIRIPADHVDRPVEQGGDPLCGLSNHEGPRLEYLRRTMIEIGAVRDPDDVGFDAFGNLEWVLEDPSDGIPRERKKIVYWDGHCDTVRALRETWHARTGGLDPYLGLVDAAKLDRDFLRRELGWLPPDEEWHHLLFGRGSADQLGGVVSQIIASRILVETLPEGSLRGVIVRGYVTVAEEDNDGGGPLFITRRILPGAPAEVIPDVVILTDSTGDAHKGALGLHRGQRGRMQIEVTVTGRSCHGSMPWEGLNPLEWGGALLAEAARRAGEGNGFTRHPFLGPGTRTASWARLDTPSDCAVPERFTFRFDRRLTAGETPEVAVSEIESLDAVREAHAAGLRIEVSIPRYEQPTWRGFVPGNPQVYMGWVTPEEHPAIAAAVATWRASVTPFVPKGRAEGGALRAEPRVDRWIFSTDGVGWPVPAKGSGLVVPDGKRWVNAGDYRHAAMFGIGTGIEQNTHKIGEVLDTRELQHAAAFLARYPAVFAATA